MRLCLIFCILSHLPVRGNEPAVPTCVPFRCLVRLNHVTHHEALLALPGVKAVRPLFPEAPVTKQAARAGNADLCAPCPETYFVEGPRYCIVEGYPPEEADAMHPSLGAAELVALVTPHVAWADVDHTVPLSAAPAPAPRSWPSVREALDAMGLPAADVAHPCAVAAVIDTGCDLQHPALAGRLWPGDADAATNSNGNAFLGDVHGWDFTGDQWNGSHWVPDPDAPFMEDQTNHGTHCAGLLAGDGVGAAGGARLMVLKAFSGRTGCVSDVARAVNYAVRNGAKLVSMSLAFPHDNQAFAAVLAAASRCAVLVAAAGNEGLSAGTDPRFPAAYPFVVGVEAQGCDPDGHGRFERAAFSNRDYDASAPGSDIYSTIPGNAYRRLSGTSMATPLVAGAALRFWADFPFLSADEVRARVTHFRGNYPALSGQLPILDPVLEGVDLDTPDGRIYEGQPLKVIVRGRFPGRTQGPTLTLRAFWEDAHGNQAAPDQKLVVLAATGAPLLTALTVTAPPNVGPLVLRIAGNGGADLGRFPLPVTRTPPQPTANVNWSQPSLMVFRAGYTYLIDQPLTVPAGTLAIINPGARLQIATSAAIDVNGWLRCDGTADNPVIITVAPGINWGGFDLRDNPEPSFNTTCLRSGSRMTHTFLRAETDPLRPRRGVAIQGANLYLADNRFEGFHTAVVYDHGTVIERNLFQHNTYGITNYVPGWKPRIYKTHHCFQPETRVITTNHIRDNVFVKSEQASITVRWVENGGRGAVVGNAFLKDETLFPCLSPVEIISPQDVPLEGNYWGTDRDLSAAVVGSAPPVVRAPAPPPDGPPVVRAIYMSLPGTSCVSDTDGPDTDCFVGGCTPVGAPVEGPTDGPLLTAYVAGDAAVTVTFSQPMDTTRLPRVTISRDPGVPLRAADFDTWTDARSARFVLRVDAALPEGVHVFQVTDARDHLGRNLPPLDCRFRFRNGVISGMGPDAVGDEGKTCTFEPFEQASCSSFDDPADLPFTAVAYHLLRRTETGPWVRVTDAPLLAAPGPAGVTDSTAQPGMHYHYAVQPLQADMRPGSLSAESCVTLSPAVEDDGPGGTNPTRR